jgi:geranylgeranyl diphosphate synthase type I
VKAFFAARKEEMLAYLRRIIEEKAQDLSKIHPLGRDAVERILDFAGRGKMLRGGLVGLGYALYAGEDRSAAVPTDAGASGGGAGEHDPMPEDVVAVGTAMELFQSAFLIHDDIMDRDTRRRGVATVFSQYAEAAKEEGLPDADHMGESLGICAGDIAFFVAYEILGRVGAAATPGAAGAASAAADKRGVDCAPLFSFVSQELSYVGVAQMLDVRWGNGADRVDETDVLELYRYKTGRYTFSLPLSAGALLAGAGQDGRERLERIGELLGVVFQLRDDELGLFGDEDALGKPIGSDVREGKRTPFFLSLMERVEERERTKLLDIFGNEDSTEEDIEHVRSLVEELGVRDEIIRTCEGLSREAREEIEALEETAPDAYRILEDLLDYGLNRQK